MSPRALRFLCLLTCVYLLSAGRAGAQTYSGDFYAAPFVGGSPQWVSFVNDLVGWRSYANAGFLGLSTTVGNIEAGLVWTGHEVFRRPTSSTNAWVSYSNTYALNQLDYHATMVGHVLVGNGFNGTNYNLVGLGMAPDAALLSGSVATSFSTNLGGFDTTYASVVAPYRDMMTGAGLPGAADVINSSWGGSDPTASSPEALALDGLAAQNRFSALVRSAGNSTNQPVGWPGSGFNGITVGALGDKTFLVPAEFSSRGLVDFYNPASGITTSNARVAVDLAAPGENFYLAAYLGNEGGLPAGLPDFVQQPSPTNLYFINVGGTSFASPMVAGGVAILKDVANRDMFWNLNAQTNAKDTRVVQSVLMAGAMETYGWNNGQARATNGALITTRALDPAAGAGAMELVRAGNAYFFGTRDVAGGGGGTITGQGWDFGTVALGGSNDYIFDGNFGQSVELTVSLNWFAGRSFDMETNLGSDLSFADLNLEVWEVGGGSFASLVASSFTVYNNAEYLRLDLPGDKTYGLRVSFGGMIFDLTAGVTNESYGLAWLTTPYDTLYWNGGATNGTWSGQVTSWNALPGTNAPTDAITTALDQLVIAPGGTNASLSVLVDGQQLARGITISNGAVTLRGTNGAGVNLQGGGLVLAAGATGNATLVSSVPVLLSGDQSWSNASTFSLNVAGTLSGQGDLALRSSAAGSIALSGAVGHFGALINDGSGSANTTVSGTIGTNVTGILQNSPTSRLVLSGGNSFTGATRIAAGTLELAGTGGNAALGATASIRVESGATLLLATSGQVSDVAAITLSGGTIARAGGVSEVFGNLNLTAASFLDYGTGAAGNFTFGAYTPSALKLVINNFSAPGSTLVFGSDLSSSINNSSLFEFTNGGFSSATWNQTTQTFTITAIPEPGTWLAAVLLFSLFACGCCRDCLLRRAFRRG